jgi:retinol dehydrogenase 12
MTGKQMQDKTILVTGAASGIGFYTALGLARLGYRIIMACRNPVRAAEARAAIQQQTGNNALDVVELNLASLSSVRACARLVSSCYGQVHVLINNAGSFSMRHELTVDGFEKTMCVNFLAPFLLTSLMLPILTAAPGARIINVGSDAYRQGRLDLAGFHLQTRYLGMRAYGASKLALLLFSLELARRIKDSGTTVNALHPGHAATAIWPENTWLEKLVSSLAKKFMISAEEASRTSIYLASSDEVAGITGMYFSKCRPAEVPERFTDPQLAKALCAAAARLTGFEGPPWS